MTSHWWEEYFYIPAFFPFRKLWSKCARKEKIIHTECFCVQYLYLIDMLLNADAKLQWTMTGFFIYLWAPWESQQHLMPLIRTSVAVCSVRICENMKKVLWSSQTNENPCLLPPACWFCCMQFSCILKQHWLHSARSHFCISIKHHPFLAQCTEPITQPPCVTCCQNHQPYMKNFSIFICHGLCFVTADSAGSFCACRLFSDLFLHVWCDATSTSV